MKQSGPVQRFYQASGQMTQSFQLIAYRPDLWRQIRCRGDDVKFLGSTRHFFTSYQRFGDKGKTSL